MRVGRYGLRPVTSKVPDWLAADCPAPDCPAPDCPVPDCPAADCSAAGAVHFSCLSRIETY